MSHLPRRRRFGCCVLLLAWTTLCVAADPTTIDYDREVAPLLAEYCGDCHGAELQEGRVRFDTLSTDLVTHRAAAQTWREALQQLDAGKMPPEDATPLPDVAREKLAAWIRRRIAQAIAVQRSSGGRVVMRRLNRTEYQNTMRDLFGLEMDYVRDLPPDAISPDGYRNHGRSLRMSALQLETYLAAARRALARAIVTGPPPQVYRHRFEQSNVRGWRGPTEMSNKLERAQKFLARMVDDYPEQGRFRIRIQTEARFRPGKGFPRLEVAVGYRPDTQVHFRVAEVVEIVREELQQIEVTGRLENFPLPVRGQGKYPGLVVRLRNVYDDGSPIPTKLEKVQRGGREVKAFRPEPHLPHLRIRSVEFEGPVYASWPPAEHRRILFDSPLRYNNELAYVREVLERFLTRAFRREARRAEVEDFLVFFGSVRPHFTRFEEAIRETLAMVLIQPEFLYLLEPAGEKKRGLDDHELASRLSYFLWSTMPDARLRALATQGLLQQPAVLKGEVQRHLADPRAQRFVTDFVNQWLRLTTLENVAIDATYYPEFRASLKEAMRQETAHLFAHLLADNAKAGELLTSEFTWVNEPLARHYGLPPVYGQAYRRVRLETGSQRAGLLGHGSVLLAGSDGKHAHPIRRAVWIRSRLLDDPPAPPPPDVPELDATDARFAELTVREQLEIHRAKSSCASCHRNLDPWGIALSHFDAVGRWQTKTRQRQGNTWVEKPVSAVAKLGDGTELVGAGGLREHLMVARGDDFARALLRHLMTYALGRTLELVDDAEIDEIAGQLSAREYRLGDMIQAVVASRAFQTK